MDILIKDNGNKKDKLTKLDNVAIGKVFFYKGQYYVKTRAYWECYNINTNEICGFKKNDLVREVESTIIVEEE